LFRDSTVAILKMLKKDCEDDKLEAALDMVATYIKEEYARRTWPTKMSREVADKSAPSALEDSPAVPPKTLFISKSLSRCTSATIKRSNLSTYC